MNDNPPFGRSAAVAALRDRFADGTLLDPRGGDCGNTMDLVLAIARHCGVAGLQGPGSDESWESLLGRPRHLVLVILDGLGINLLERLAPDGFFRSSEFRELRALVPSTTSCVLTSLATAAYPAEHGIAGWFTYMPEHRQTAIPLPFADRFTEKPLSESGVSVEDLFRVPSILPHMAVTTRCVLPEDYWDSAYSRYWRGSTHGEGYRDLADAVDRVLRGLRNGSEPSYTYLYVPHIDGVSHTSGPGGGETLGVARSVEEEIDRLARGLPGDARLVATADHGQIHVPEEGIFFVFDGDPLLDLLEAPPSGEGRLPVFHVRSGKHEPFCELFRQRYGRFFDMLSIDEAESLELFGPGRLSQVARERFGDYVAIPHGAHALNYSPPQGDSADAHLGRHGGLSPEELRVPLLLR